MTHAQPTAASLTPVRDGVLSDAPPVTTTTAHPLGLVLLDQFDVPYAYEGVKVVQLGEDGDEEIAVFTADPEFAVRAADHFIREHVGAIPDEILVVDETQPVRWRQVFDHCGCVDHEIDDDGYHECKCLRPGLPPCADQDNEYSFLWVLSNARKGDPGAVEVVFVDVDYHFPPVSAHDGVQAKLAISPSGQLQEGEPC
jgi:hypothetical protein